MSKTYTLLRAIEREPETMRRLARCLEAIAAVLGLLGSIKPGRVSPR